MATRRNQLSLDQLFRALADRTRLRLLNLIADREICVCYLVEILKSSQPKVSRHLAYLRRTGIVAARREGKWMHYRLAVPEDNVARGILNGTLKHLRGEVEMQRDVAKLGVTCCASRNAEVPQNAPLPVLLSRRSSRSAARTVPPGPARRLSSAAINR